MKYRLDLIVSHTLSCYLIREWYCCSFFSKWHVLLPDSSGPRPKCSAWKRSNHNYGLRSFIYDQKSLRCIGLLRSMPVCRSMFTPLRPRRKPNLMMLPSPPNSWSASNCSWLWLLKKWKIRKTSSNFETLYAHVRLFSKLWLSWSRWKLRNDSVKLSASLMEYRLIHNRQNALHKGPYDFYVYS